MERIEKKVTVFGSFVMDLMGRAPHLPTAGETMKGIVFEIGSGDKGFSQGVATHKAGVDVTMMTELGRGTFADITLNIVSELHMDTGRVLYSETAETECALVMVGEDSSQNEIMVILGACNTITGQEVDSLEDLVDRSECLLTQLEANVPSVEHIMDIAYRKGVRVILNITPVQPVSDELLSKIGLITPNGMEVEILTGIKMDSEEAADKAVDWFFSKGVKNVLTTLEYQGVYIGTGEKKGTIPVYKVEAVDTTGAGGVSNNGLLAALAEGKNLWGAADFANALAALSVQKTGTTSSILVREEINAFMAANRQTADY